MNELLWLKKWKIELIFKCFHFFCSFKDYVLWIFIFSVESCLLKFFQCFSFLWTKKDNDKVLHFFGDTVFFKLKYCHEICDKRKFKSRIWLNYESLMLIYNVRDLVKINLVNFYRFTFDLKIEIIMNNILALY